MWWGVGDDPLLKVFSPFLMQHTRICINMAFKMYLFRVGHIFRSFHPYTFPGNKDTHGINTARTVEVSSEKAPPIPKNNVFLFSIDFLGKYRPWRSWGGGYPHNQKFLWLGFLNPSLTCEYMMVETPLTCESRCGWTTTRGCSTCTVLTSSTQTLALWPTGSSSSRSDQKLR